MNICIYTSSDPSISNLLNIGYLLHERPQHNYSFLTIEGNKHVPTIQDKLKRKYGELRFNDGRFDFSYDLQQIDKRLSTQVQPFNKEQFDHGNATAVNGEQSEAFIKKVQPDVILQAGAGILKPNIFSLAKIATINVHHGIAPEVRGIDSTFWCMFYGIRHLIGVTCHVIDEQLDTGCVIKQRRLETKSNSFVDVQCENYLIGRDVLVDSIDSLEAKRQVTIQKTDIVKSHYFGVVDPFLYYALKKRNFEPLMKISQRTAKSLPRNSM